MDGLWVAREKLHGANFSFTGDLNGDSYISWSFNSRRQKLEIDEPFHGFYDLFEKFQKENILTSAYFYARGCYPTYSKIQFFGELVGPTISKGLKVDYGSELDFYVFDIKVYNNRDQGIYVPDYLVETICEAAGLKMAPKLGEGTFEELSKISREFESVAKDIDSSYSGLYVVEPPKNNPAEGFVLMPDEPVFMPNGSRLAFKFKSDRFSEKIVNKVRKEAPAMSELDQGVLNLMLQYVNESRLDNVMSKESFTQKEFGKAQGLFARDALEDIQKDMMDNPIVFDDKKSVMKIFQAEIANLLRKYWSANF